MAAAAVAASTACAPASDNTAAGTLRELHQGRAGHAVPGIFTFGTDQPVYPPWYMGDNPASGEGFESALAYAVAAKIDYAARRRAVGAGAVQRGAGPGAKGVRRQPL